LGQGTGDRCSHADLRGRQHGRIEAHGAGWDCWWARRCPVSQAGARHQLAARPGHARTRLRASSAPPRIRQPEAILCYRQRYSREPRDEGATITEPWVGKPDPVPGHGDPNSRAPRTAQCTGSKFGATRATQALLREWAAGGGPVGVPGHSRPIHSIAGARKGSGRGAVPEAAFAGLGPRFHPGFLPICPASALGRQVGSALA